MNIILVETDEIQGNSVLLEGERAKHIVKILRAETGDTVRVGVIDGWMGTGRVNIRSKKYPFQVSLAIELEQPPPKRPRIDLVLALPRPIMLRRILSQIAALGVGSIHLVNAARVEKSFWKSRLLETDEYRLHLLHGLEQAVDTVVPEVQIHKRFKPFIEDFLPPELPCYSSLICAHPGGDSSLNDAVDKEGRTLLAIGPEGGWVDYEVEKFQEHQFSICTIGQRILKVDTAVVALHAKISSLAGWD